MSVSYDVFVGAFLGKVTDYDFPLQDWERNQMVDGYMKRSMAEFDKVCRYGFVGKEDDLIREYNVDVPESEIYEIADIVSEGMVSQWLKPYLYRQDNLENVLNTKDFSSYSPAELLYRMREVYSMTKSNFTNMVREYSYNHGNLRDLYL